MQMNMENLPSNVLDFNNNELNNNGASINKSSSSSNGSSDSCSSGSSSISSELLTCHNETINITLETTEDQNVLDDLLAKFKTVSDETIFISEIPSAKEAFIITPGETKIP